MINQSELLTHPRWKTNHIVSTAGSQYKMYWLFAIFWNALVWAAIILGGDNILKAFDENPVFYLFVSFPFIGLFLVYQSVRETMAWIKFGKTPLTLTPFPGQLGGVVSGQVDIPVLFDATSKVKVSLSCTHHYWERRHRENRKTSDVVWQDNVVVRPRPSAKGNRIHFEFTPLSDLPASQLSNRDYHEWTVNIHMPLKGNDYVRQFIIPVCNASDQVIEETARFARQPATRHDQSVALPDSDIPLISSIPGATRFDYPVFRNKGIGFGLMLVAVMFAVMIWFMQQEFELFLPVTSLVFFGFAGLVAVALFVFSIFVLGNSLTVDVSASGVKVQRIMLGFSFGGDIKRSDIADILVERSGSSSNGQTSRVWYSLKLIEHNGMETTVGDSLEGHSYAEMIRQQIIDTLGSHWKPSEITERQKGLKRKELPAGIKWIGKLASILSRLVIPLALIYDLREQVSGLIQFVASSF